MNNTLYPKDRLETLETIKNTSGHILLFGDRGIGKTIFALEELAVAEKTIYLNMQSIGESNGTELLDWLGEDLTDELGLSVVNPGNELKTTIEQYGPVTIILDEWEIFLLRDFIFILSDLVQLAKVKLILIGKHLLSEQEKTIAISTAFTQINLPHFTLLETIEIIDNRKNIKMTVCAKQLLWQLVGGNGILLTRCLFDLFREYPNQLCTEQEVLRAFDLVKNNHPSLMSYCANSLVRGDT